jgi:hypothetical protein
MVFRNNLIISNVCHVMFGESYGLGSNTRFYGNTFVKVGNRKDYRTIQIGYWNKTTTGHQLFDSVFKGGAGYDRVKFDAQGKRDFSVGWSVTVKTAPGAKVTVCDRDGRKVFAGKADAKGVAVARVLQYIHRPDGKALYTPQTLTAELGGKAASKTVTVDAEMTVDLPVR